jgi:hypothetical protein
MTFKSTIWRPIAIAASALNLAGLGYAVGMAEPWHAALHGFLAAGFAFWAERLLRHRPVASLDVESRFEALDADMSALRQELSEAQERLDFTERLLAQDAETRRVGPQRYEP